VTVDSGPLLQLITIRRLTFAVAADDTNLYFLADVKDSKVVYGIYEPATGWYEEDSVEFYLNTTGIWRSSYRPGIAQIGIMAANFDESRNANYRRR